MASLPFEYKTRFGLSNNLSSTLDFMGCFTTSFPRTQAWGQVVLLVILAAGDFTHKAYFSGTLREEHACCCQLLRRTGKKKGKLLSSLSRARGPGCCLWGRVVVLCTTLYRAWKCAESIGPLLLNKPLLDTTNYTRCSYKQVEPMAKQLQHAAASI